MPRDHTEGQAPILATFLQQAKGAPK